MKQDSHPKSLHFDEHLTSPARLRIIVALASGEELSFTELKHVTRLSDGNLHVQTRRLAQSGHILMERSVRGSRPVTSFRISDAGLHALKSHVRRLQAALAGTGGVMRQSGSLPRRDDSQVWQAKGQRQ
jgi:hypothetical protein